MTDRQFVKLIARLRKTLSLAEIADRLGVKKQAVWNWANGRNGPSGPTVKLAESIWKEKA